MALKTFTTGEVLTADDTNVYLLNTIFARKTATESVTSSTTLQDDDHLSVSVAASSVYELSCVLVYDGDAAGDVSIQWSFPSGASISWYLSSITGGGAAGTDDRIAYSAAAGPAALGCLGAGSTLAAHILGLVTVASTAGTFKLTWAQSVSNGTASRMFAGSYICLRRVF